MSERIQDWKDSPVTQEFLEALKEKARGIRYNWYATLAQKSPEDIIYVQLLEDIIRGINDSPVIEDKETVEKDAKRDGFEI